MAGSEPVGPAVAGAVVLTVPFSTSVYALPAIKKAAYSLGDRFAIVVLPESEGTVIVEMHVPPTENPQQARMLLTRAVADYDLREIVARETAPLRDLIIAHAFSRTALIAAQLEQANVGDDFLGVTAPDPSPPKPPR